MFRLLLVLAAFLMLPFSVVCAAVKGPAIGDVPPPILGKDREGHEIDLTQLRGKVVVVTFWASWCTFCLKELPALNAVQEKTGDEFLKIVAVNVKDDNTDYRAMTKQMKDYALTLTRDRSGTIADGYGVENYPNLWIIDPQGKVASRHRGYGEDSLAQIVEEIRRVMLVEMERQKGSAAPAQANAGG